MASKPSIHDQVAELVELAAIYAQDGAFYTGARKLREAAEIYQRRAEETGPRKAGSAA